VVPEYRNRTQATYAAEKPERCAGVRSSHYTQRRTVNDAINLSEKMKLHEVAPLFCGYPNFQKHDVAQHREAIAKNELDPFSHFDTIPA